MISFNKITLLCYLYLSYTSYYCAALAQAFYCSIHTFAKLHGNDTMFDIIILHCSGSESL